ncbi:hypothetical protein [Armatimonas sp.]|uniref:hypothetical protein n=1 Tax=Armatimonas sp. TaxID=1872638 RepID=UPI003750E4EB
MRGTKFVVPLAVLLLAAFAGAQEDPPAGRERQAAECLDQVIQPRFRVIGSVTIGLGVFGNNSRTMMPAPKPKPLSPIKTREIRGHKNKVPPELKAENPEEKALLEKVTALKCRYRLGFLHLGYRLDRKTGRHLDSSEPRLELGEVENNESATLSGKIVEQLRAVKRGTPLELENAGWRVFVRPIKASKMECASCHQGINSGQVMGAMVYLVQSKSPLPLR